MNPTKNEKILIIESDITYGQGIADALKKEGYAVTLVKNGTDGIKSIMDTMPHLILLDVVLPGTDGYEVLAQKHAEPVLARIPVFLMSAQNVPINMQRVPQGSVQEFLMAIDVDSAGAVAKVNRQFGHESMAVPESISESIKNPAAATTSNKKKVLWVEDDKLIGTILARKLVSSGLDLFHAKNSEEAMVALKQVIPDIIVLDLLLPGMSGFDILQQIRMDQGLKNIPVLILSNLSKPSDIEKAKILGAQKFLVKAAASLDQIVAEVKSMTGSV
ncbi:MAG: response regulator [Patescibacteria group bacterium]